MKIEHLKLKIIATLASILLGLGVLLIFQSQNLSKTRLVFCDVGQGDGILIASGSKQVVVDGGPDNKILSCPEDKMPFWDRTIELMVLTHPQKDHMAGLLDVLARYKVRMIVLTGVKNNTQIFKAWEEAVQKEGAKIYTPDINDQFLLQGPTLKQGRTLVLTVLWPSKEMIGKWTQNPPSDLNQTSIVMRLDFGPSADGCAYLTGDIPKEILENLIDRSCQILKVAHHGSKTGTNEKILDLAKPQTAVIQVGRDNRFGHPHQQILDMLSQRAIKILRNDISGTIELSISQKPLPPSASTFKTRGFSL